MNAETYAVISYEEVIEAKEKKEEAFKDFIFKYKNYLITCLCNTGLINVIVCVKQTGDRGVLRVEENSGSINQPYKIKFYPCKKNGEISLKSKYVASFFDWRMKELLSNLQAVFESTGESSAS